MDPVTIAALGLSAIPGLNKIFGGDKQVRDAEKLAASNVFTPYTAPQEVAAATNILGNEFRNGMPTTAAESRIANAATNSFANGVQGASSGGDVLDLASRTQYNENQALNNLNEQAQAFRTNALGAYVNQLGNEAAYKDKAYQINVLDPYNRKANLAASMYGAGKTNQASGWDSLATAGLAGATAYQNYKKTGA